MSDPSRIIFKTNHQRGLLAEFGLDIPMAYMAAEREHEGPFLIVDASYPSMRPCNPEEEWESKSRVKVEIGEARGRSRVEGILNDWSRPRNDDDNAVRPLYVGEEGGFQRYETATVSVFKNVEVWDVKELLDGSLVGFCDLGEHMGIVKGNRRILGHRFQVTYQFRKDLGADRLEMDAAVVSLIEMFMGRRKQ